MGRAAERRSRSACLSSTSTPRRVGGSWWSTGTRGRGATSKERLLRRARAPSSPCCSGRPDTMIMLSGTSTNYHLTAHGWFMGGHLTARTRPVGRWEVASGLGGTGDEDVAPARGRVPACRRREARRQRGPRHGQALVQSWSSSFFSICPPSRRCRRHQCTPLAGSCPPGTSWSMFVRRCGPWSRGWT
jgi:hypothetical protein